MGYPGPVLRGCPKAEPRNLAPGWVGFDFEAAFERPVKIINDAAMQALGSYNGGTMLFLGLGTGLGSALILDGSVHAMELAHLPYKRGSYEDYVGIRGLEKHGKKKWRRPVERTTRRREIPGATFPTTTHVAGLIAGAKMACSASLIADADSASHWHCGMKRIQYLKSGCSALQIRKGITAKM